MSGSPPPYTYFSNAYGKFPQIDRTEDHSEIQIKQLATYIGVNEDSFYSEFVAVKTLIKNS